jgi:ABC-type cobalamin/Fe3+-siderophores transport system ATPase subunit
VAWFCHRVLVLDEGRIVVDGSPEEAITESTIRSIYDEPCEVRTVGGLPVVVPGFARRSLALGRVASEGA